MVSTSCSFNFNSVSSTTTFNVPLEHQISTYFLNRLGLSMSGYSLNDVMSIITIENWVTKIIKIILRALSAFVKRQGRRVTEGTKQAQRTKAHLKFLYNNYLHNNKTPVYEKSLQFHIVDLMFSIKHYDDDQC